MIMSAQNYFDLIQEGVPIFIQTFRAAYVPSPREEREWLTDMVECTSPEK